MPGEKLNKLVNYSFVFCILCFGFSAVFMALSWPAEVKTAIVPLVEGSRLETYRVNNELSDITKTLDMLIDYHEVSAR